jgi:hypothetical protein
MATPQNEAVRRPPAPFAPEKGGLQASMTAARSEVLTGSVLGSSFSASSPLPPQASIATAPARRIRIMVAASFLEIDESLPIKLRTSALARSESSPSAISEKSN